MTQENQTIQAPANSGAPSAPAAGLSPQITVLDNPNSTTPPIPTPPVPPVPAHTRPVVVAGTGQVAPPPENTSVNRVKLALSLGSVLVELRGRVLEAQLRGPENVVKPNDPSDGYWLAGTWRGLFSRAYSLHRDLLGDVPVDLARYNMADDKPLYLTNRFDFINIGLENTNIKFGLAEKLRQALNFLTSLYQRLDRVDSVLSQIFEGDAPVLSFPPDQAPPDRYNYLIKDLTALVEALITAWDNYVRERLFAESNTMLWARYGYAAGRALSELSWNLTVKTAPFRGADIKTKYPNPVELDNLVYSFWLEQFKPENISYLQRQLMVLMSVLEEDYQSRQVKGEQPTPTAHEDSSTEILDLKSSKAGVLAVVQSLDYWQKTILEMSERGVMQRTNQSGVAKNVPVDSQPPNWAETLKLHPNWNFDYLMDLRMALNEQQGNWFSLVAGRQDLTDFRVVNVAGDLIQNYSREITHMATTNLQEAFTQIEHEFDQLADVGKNSIKGIADTGRDALTGLFKNRWLLVGLGLAVVLILLVVVGLLVVGAISGPGLIASLITPILGLVGIQPGLNRAVREGTQNIDQQETTGKGQLDATNATSQKTIATSASISAMVLTAASQVRDFLETAFAKGYAQLQRELGLVSATLAVTSPLIEFVVRNCDPTNDMEFLSKIAWNDSVKRSQRDRIIIAAFGPVGAFLISGDTPEDAPSNAARQEQQKAAQVQAAATDPALSKAA